MLANYAATEHCEFLQVTVERCACETRSVLGLQTLVARGGLTGAGLFACLVGRKYSLAFPQISSSGLPPYPALRCLN